LAWQAEGGVNKWQPIETAPLDGTVVWIKFADDEIFKARNHGEAGYRHNDWWTDDGENLDFGYGQSNPTHWMPE
jgi:hypothetical protein